LSWFYALENLGLASMIYKAFDRQYRRCWASLALLSQTTGIDLANFKNRLKPLEAKVAQNGIILNETKVQALGKKKHDDEACGGIESAHPSQRHQKLPKL
jgi:hypothetical protein